MMMRIRVVLFVMVLCGPSITGQEIAVPVKPVVTTVTSYRVTRFALEMFPEWRFTITYQDSNGIVYTDEHYGPSTITNPTGGEPLVNPNGADAFLKQLNTMNLSTTSLTKLLFKHLMTHGKIQASTVTGEVEK